MDLFSGEATKLLFACAGALIPPIFNRFINPRIEAMVSKTHIELYQTYSAEPDFLDNSIVELTLEIKQTGSAIKGTMLSREKGRKDRIYNLKGTFRHDIVMFTFIADKKNRPSGGAGTLKVACDGDCLVGHLAYRHDTISEVKSVECNFHVKQSSD